MRLTLALALGLFIGLERERRGKEAGLRTFGFISLLGALGSALGENFALLTLVLTGMLTIFLNLQTMRHDQGTELTTSAAMLVTCAVGILCGQGHRLTPAAVMVITTALLAWKESLAGFTMCPTGSCARRWCWRSSRSSSTRRCRKDRSAREACSSRGAAWLTVILIAGIGFVNYILWKAYGARGAELAGFLGGLVNSSVTVSELAGRVSETRGASADLAYRGILLATGAMVIRNAVLLAILAPPAFFASAGAHVLMLVMSAAFVAPSWRSGGAGSANLTESRLELPFSFWVAVKYGVLFLVLHVVGVLAQHFAGQNGFYLVSVLGGLVSSASAVAAAASLAANGTLSPDVAGIGAVISSVTSVLVNLPFVLKARDGQLTRKLAFAMVAIAAAGIAGAYVWAVFSPALIGPLQIK